MNSDYVAWNGERYVWPPPDGWYLASDGRWWAPDTGPEMDGWAENPSVPGPAMVTETTEVSPVSTPPQTNTAPPQTDTDPQQGDASLVGQDVTAIMAPPAQTDEPYIPAPAPGGFPGDGHSFGRPETMPEAGPQTELAPAFEPTTTQQPTTGQTPALMAPQDHLVGDTQTNFSPGPPSTGETPMVLADAATEAPKAPVNRSQSMTMVAAGLLVVAALGIAALLAFFGGDDDDELQPSASLQPSDEPSELVVTTPSTSDVMNDGAMEDGAMEDGSTDSTEADEAMSEEEASNAGSTTTSVEATGEDAIRIGQFRTLLEDNDITAAELTGDDLTAFGVTACSYAESSGDLGEYEQVRSGVLDGAQNEELSVDELQFIVDAAVTVFCPEDATRLGITVGTE